ncbi:MULTISPECIES: hypothetical protein [unclassified Variovorax]|uniref:hypothetical protein n=1 Tax=unclassified Variovorax TaxID=663243 RepID=UPI002578C225|nr:MULTISPECIES: hypothetical protein [unclassified Variovorax]MDM0088013.1 hypothetical protein [Variovorax sp. J22G40]MDM0146086.1 hypothetical protein [Variovorax sp. J2P1-31]
MIEVFSTGPALWSWRFKAGDATPLAQSTLSFDSEGAARLDAMEVLGQMASADIDMASVPGA